MKVIDNIEQNTDQWQDIRKGKITGSKVGDVLSTSGITMEVIRKELKALGITYPTASKKEELEALLPLESKTKLRLEAPKKVGFYQLIADKLAIEDGEEDGMDRGHQLEMEALDLFEEMEGVKLRRGLFCVSDEHPDIAISPDGITEDFTRAAEVKCLSTRIYLKAYFENKIPSDYDFQKLQYFIVNPDLERLDFVFYDPRVTAKPMFFITFFREDVQEEVDLYKQAEIEMLAEVERLTELLAF